MYIINNFRNFMFNFILIKRRLKNMVFKKKKPEEESKEIEEVVSPEAEEIEAEDIEEVEEVNPKPIGDLDNQLNVVLTNFENRIQSLEAFFYRLKNI